MHSWFGARQTSISEPATSSPQEKREKFLTTKKRKPGHLWKIWERRTGEEKRLYLQVQNWTFHLCHIKEREKFLCPVILENGHRPASVKFSLEANPRKSSCWTGEQRHTSQSSIITTAGAEGAPINCIERREEAQSKRERERASQKKKRKQKQWLRLVVSRHKCDVLKQA